MKLLVENILMVSRGPIGGIGLFLIVVIFARRTTVPDPAAPSSWFPWGFKLVETGQSCGISKAGPSWVSMPDPMFGGLAFQEITISASTET